MAQMPIHAVAGRAERFNPATTYPPPPGAAARPPTPAAKPSQAFDPGAISGGALRPGSIDQMTFRQRLAAANQGGPIQHPAAGKSPLMVPPAPGGAPSIPTLTPAQLAALGLDVSGLEPSAMNAPAGQLGPRPTVPMTAIPMPTVPESPATTPDLAAAIAPETVPATATAAEATPAPETPVAPEDQQAALPAATEDPDAPQAPVPGAHLGRDGVWELPRQPSKDEREWFQGMNAKWRIVENPESVKLFLGEDGKFGWDDFVDLINPLQHIPLVNLAYRALTGDEINGAAQMVGAVAMGPLSTLSTVADLAFKAETGKGLAANGIAMLLGDEPAPDDMASYATAAGGTQLAELSPTRRGSNR